MLARKILAKHVTKTTALAMFGTIVILTLLQLLFTYLGELSDMKGSYGTWQALQYVFWGTPRYLNTILPISALIGAAVGLGSLASNSELIVMRAAGVSLWRIVGWVMRPTLLLVVFSFALSEWVIPYANEQAKVMKMQKTQHKAASLGEVRGYWTRENNRFVYIDYANAEGNLRNVKVLDFDQNFHLKTVTNAEQGQFLDKGNWQLAKTEQVDIFPQGHAQLIKIEQQKLALALQPKYVHMVTIDAADLAPTELLSFMSYMHQYSQIPKVYKLAFWQKIGTPFALIALVVVACSFIFGPLRQQSMGFRLVISLFVGLGFFYIQDFMGYASLVYAPSAAWFVFGPISIIFAIGAYLLHRAR